MKKTFLPFIGIAILLCGLLWVACQKSGTHQSPVDTKAPTDVIAIPVDTVSPNPIYNVTDSCGVTCLAGSCSRKATYDARYCKLQCKCGGVGGAYPQCDLTCNFPTPVPDTVVIGTPATIEYVVEANEKQLQYQATLVGQMKSSRLKNADKIVSEMQEIYNMFKANNGRITGDKAKTYFARVSRTEALQNE